MARSRRPSGLEAFDEVQHDPVSDPPTLYELTDHQAIEAIKEWFFENFEDPSQNTPFNSADGGYQYIYGGPYETRDIIENAFYRLIRKDVRDAAIEELEQDSDLWVPSESRRQPPKDPAENARSLASTEQHAQMLEGLRKLEETLRDYPIAPAGMGHNRPPEPLELEPLEVDDRTELSDALTVLEVQPVTPADDGRAAKAALNVVESKRAKLLAWLQKQGDIFTTEAVKEAGKGFGKWMPRAFFLFLADHMFQVSTMVKAWLTSIHVLF
jgi:hypothetical protein